ncbi:cell wall hydrolase, partial [Acinetobacter baumannii]
IQGVINQPKQFSAINDLGTWEKLPKPSDKHFEIVLHHIQSRARGTASQIKGATHFFNPDTSHPAWGGPIKAHPIASYGVPPDSHIHGFPENYRP